jgi:hypothetical protein
MNRKRFTKAEDANAIVKPPAIVVDDNEMAVLVEVMSHVPIKRRKELQGVQCCYFVVACVINHYSF